MSDNQDPVTIGVCGGCGKKKQVFIANDPYAYEINDETIEVTMCEDCFQQRRDDI